MKKLSLKILSMAVVAVSLVLTSCTKEAGPQGEPGVDGNANVTQISFGSKTMQPGVRVELLLPNITKEIGDKSIILTYALSSVEPVWYILPGTGNGGARDYRTYFTATDPSCKLTILMVSGSTSETFSAFRVLIIPANNLVNGRLSQLPYDINNYESVRSYFNLPK